METQQAFMCQLPDTTNTGLILHEVGRRWWWFKELYFLLGILELVTPSPLPPSKLCIFPRWLLLTFLCMSLRIIASGKSSFLLLFSVCVQVMIVLCNSIYGSQNTLQICVNYRLLMGGLGMVLWQQRSAGSTLQCLTPLCFLSPDFSWDLVVPQGCPLTLPNSFLHQKWKCCGSWMWHICLCSAAFSAGIPWSGGQLCWRTALSELGGTVL